MSRHKKLIAFGWITCFFAALVMAIASCADVASGKGNDIANYKTVRIGTQNWMAENLNYEMEGFFAKRKNKCYDGKPQNCAKYGRLYNWATAMALPASCNERRCSGQVSTKHRGICPSGWHIPSGDDWDVLIKFIHEDNGVATIGSSSAGKYLKAASGWSNNGNGTDSYGFAALPGGRGFSDHTFTDIGGYGIWWESSEENNYDAYNRNINALNERVHRDDRGKSMLYSVRCLED